MPDTPAAARGGVAQHQTDAATGCCLETCHHPDHDGPVSVLMMPELKTLFDEWLSNLDLEARHFPTEPDEMDGIRQYVVIVQPGHPLLQPSPLDGRLSAGNAPRASKRARR